MKIMHMLPSLSSGGVEQVVLELCEGLCAHHTENVVVSAGGSMVPAIEATGARHITSSVGKKSLKTLLQIGRMAKLLREEKPDILHLHSRVPAWVGYLACRRLKANERPAIVTSFHGFHSVNAYSAIMAKGDAVIAVSRCMREHILENYTQTPQESIVVIPNSVDTTRHFPEYQPTKEWLAAWRKAHPELEDRYTLCLPGRITRLKGATHLPIILEKLHSEGIPAHAVIVGETKKGKESFRDEVVAVLKEKGMESYVTWTGHRTDLRDILCVCDVTLSLTLQPEAFGKTTLDALSLGRPVAGYEHGGVGEQLELFLPQGMVPACQAEAMADKLAEWYQYGCPTPQPSVPPPYRRENMIKAHLDLYRKLKPGV